MKENTNPQVYVGTWKKYNNGSIKGAWIDLTKCEDYYEFLRKCKALHKDEYDPEFMIQDYQYFPDGFNASDWIYEKDFNDIIQAWKEELAEDENPKELLEEYLNEMRKAWEDESMIAYFKKKNSGIYRLSNGGLFEFEKPKIETEFCFGYDMFNDSDSYDHANKMVDHSLKSEEYFIKRNLRDIDNFIDRLNDKDDYAELYMYRKSYYSQKQELNVWEFTFLTNTRYVENGSMYKDLTLCSDKDKEILLKVYQEERVKFEKRLKTYLKKWGLTKVKSWSYDRNY